MTPTKLPTQFNLSDEDFNKIDWKIVFGGLKGGVAKTTSAWLTAIEIHRRTGDRVLVVCADPLSQTLHNAYRRMLSEGIDVPFHVITWHTHEGLAKGVLAEMKRLDCRHLIIDVGGESPKILQAACTIADELVIPCSPTIPELERVQPTLVAASQVAHINEVTPSVLLVKSAHNSIAAAEAREWLTGKDWPVLGTQIPENKFYKECLGYVPADGGFYGSVLAEIGADKLDA